ncbi:sulfate transporter family-domain-containing protein [Choanephora cucurbitarum]|nr:sulfate transporter family-domain-containing protein [Choanephora cucurbitarum]
MSTIYVDNPPIRYTDQLKYGIKQLPRMAQTYVKNLFPIVDWLPSYNMTWFSGDILAALTVGILVIPQSLAYAKIANLPPVFGLYTNFVGVLLYPLFGTSKDISIGVSAVMALMVGQVMGKFYLTEQYLSGEWTAADASIMLSLFAGFITLFIGIFRLGDLFHFICQPAIAGFMGGSGITIVINQLNKIFGIPGINTSEAPYLVFGKTLANLNHASVDAAFGLSAIIYLYLVKYLSEYLMRRYPQYNRWIFFFNTSRSVVVLIFSTLICFMINRFGYFTSSPVTVLGEIPAGLGHMAVPTIKTDVVSFFLADLPGIVILLIMEHGTISNSLGKLADYKVDMSQEILAIGLSNVFSSFFCAFPSLGAFSRSAVNFKSGARTPLSSFFMGIIALLSLFFFTPAFTYVSTAALSSIIAYSVTDLISGPTVWRKYWDMHPSEFLIFACAYVISLFARIDVSVYVPIILSIIVQLYRSARPNYAFLERLDIDLELTDEKLKIQGNESSNNRMDEHVVFFPNNHPTVGPYLRPVAKGILCFQPQENIVFQNAAFVFDKLIQEIKSSTRCGNLPSERLGDRSWNNASSVGKSLEKPLLHSVVLDLSGVHQLDYSGMEALIDTAIAAERYAGQSVNWYIVTGYSMLVRKTLLFAGFGNQRRDSKMNGRFLSDLRHGVSEGGHRPGVEGCCTNDVQPEIESIYHGDRSKHHEEYEQVVEIEKVQKKPHNHMLPRCFIGNRPQYDGSEDGISQTEMGNTSPSWCYCKNKIGPAVTDRIVAVHDRYPFFFQTVHDATRAALLQCHLDQSEAA